ncbi:putative DUF1741 [Lyophyllum shimeji]|uniref:DUF1741 n=1 Tax=Lyophyllum shimeji TaxID=47721 RepID=A0A9P3PI65_LYOSH|nr:putative DUF1741 [Lyophyllum shimeji]
MPRIAEVALLEFAVQAHALETLSILIRCILTKNFSGWEVMEVLAGGVNQSDEIFMTFTALVNDILADEQAPGSIRHQTLQVALIYMCAIGQLSPGAYFLRRDLYPSIATFIKSPDTAQFTFEASLLLAVLANFHKSDAARLNPYLRCIKETPDEDLMRKICWATSFALTAAIKAYQEICDDSVKPAFTSTLGSIISSFRPDRALSIATTETPRELFKDRPIEATVILLPILEFLHANPIFPRILLEYTSPQTMNSAHITPPPFTILTLSSYLVTHASSTSSPRSLSYADLSLHILLAFVENDDLINGLCQPTETIIPICRQRLPHLPLPQPKRAPLCALLDCSVLWLRHNLHKRVAVYCYITCVRIVYRVIWFLQNSGVRLDYEWKELWSALIGLLNFLSTKIDSLDTTGGVELIVRETIVLLDLALTTSEAYLPTPAAVHEFIYELIRSSTVLRSQIGLLSTLAMPQLNARQATWTTRSSDALDAILEIVAFYESKVSQANARTAKAAMGIVAKEIEADGLYATRNPRNLQAPIRSEDVLGFTRFACIDGLALMP